MTAINDKQPLISVIVPVYNVAPYLTECLDSILAQAYTKLQIIVINDGSTDGSAEICQSYVDKDSRIELINQENKGLSAARNTGIEHARGDWLMFVDSDDYVSRDFCRIALELVQHNDSEIGVFAFEYFDMFAALEVISVPEEYSGKLDRIKALKALVYEHIKDYAWNKIYRRDMFDGIRFPEGEIFEDIATTYLLFDRAEHICVTDDVLYYYRVREGSILRGKYIELTLSKIRQRYKELSFLQKNYPDLAEGTEIAVFLDELNGCIYSCGKPELQSDYQMLKAKLLSHKDILRKAGVKKYIFVTALRISDRLFELVTRKRKKRLKL